MFRSLFWWFLAGSLFQVPSWIKLAANSPETWRWEDKPFLFGFLPILRGELLVLGRVRVPPIFVTMVLSSKTKDPSLDMGQVFFPPFRMQSWQIKVYLQIPDPYLEDHPS